MQLLNLLHMFHHRVGDFKSALHYARRSLSAAEAVAIPAAMALAHCLLGSSLRHIDDLRGARLELEAALQGGPGDRRTSSINLDFEHYNYASIALARTLWLQGFPVRTAKRRGCHIHGSSGGAFHGVSLGRLRLPLGRRSSAR
jgi:hypothetical protein